MSYIVDSGEKEYVFEALDLMRVDYIKKEIRFSVCEGCGKIYIYGEELEECCDGEPYTSYRVADIVGSKLNFAIERKKGQNLVSSLTGNELYDQLKRLVAFFGSNVALVLEGSIEELILDEHNQSRIGQILSIPATCMQYGVTFIQVNHISTLIRMLKYFDQKCGTEPKLRLRYFSIDETVPKLTRLLCGIPGFSIKLSGNIREKYSNMLEVALALSEDTFGGIPKVGPKKIETMKEWIIR